MSKPPYILDQGLSLANEDIDLTRLLTGETLRAARRLSRQFDGADGLGGEGTDVEIWREIDRQQLVAGILAGCDWPLRSVSTSDPIVLRRLVVVVDAGMGKTALLKYYFRMKLGQMQQDCLPIYLDISASHLPHSVGELPQRLVDHMRLAQGVEPGADDEKSRQLLLDTERMLRNGQVIFLLDGLDQVDTHSANMGFVRELLRHRDFSRCAFVIAGRPYSILRERELWTDSSRAEFSWRFVRLEEFTAEQQRRFLGRSSDGLEERLDLIPADGREILKVPRVLEYLRDHLTDVELREIHTPSDVYCKALRKLVKEGIQQSESAGKIGTMNGAIPPVDDQIWLALDLLGAVAFQMAVDFTAQGDPLPEGFERVENRQVPRFKNRVFQRLNASGRSSPSPIQDYYRNRAVFDADFQRLIDMNLTLDYGLFDSTHPLQFRNRSLQEFFAALWLSRQCTEGEASEFWNMVYQAGLEQSETFYWINRYLSEMPVTVRDDENWVRAASVWYRPGDGTIQGTKRSTEMLFRSWRSMHELAGEPLFDWWDSSYEELIESQDRFRQVEASKAKRRSVTQAKVSLDAFRSEFQSILNGNRGLVDQAIAKELTENFLDVEGGTFQMGTPADKQGMWAEMRNVWNALLEEPLPARAIVQNYIKRQYYESGPHGDRRYAADLNHWTKLVESRDVKVIESRFYQKHETPERGEEWQDVTTLALGQFPVLNEWFHLFDPGHGVLPSWFADRVIKPGLSRQGPCGPTLVRHHKYPRDPVIYTSWWDAWAFAEWVNWQSNDVSARCRLPHEPEFEFVAKDRDHPDWNYWWGDQFDASDVSDCNAGGRLGHARPPEEATPSFRGRLKTDQPGFRDLLGNVWEWAANCYRPAYSRRRSPPNSELNMRVLRGGSWFNLPGNCRSTVRFKYLLDSREVNSGFRLVLVRW